MADADDRLHRLRNDRVDDDHERRGDVTRFRLSPGEFHTRVLGAGRVPLSVLEQDIDRRIAEKKR